MKQTFTVRAFDKVYSGFRVEVTLNWVWVV